ncbi:glycoside hydrolase superfamily [Obelidium mucronatum]|nr:glycoside hydrolase superfamily [Obelidium mucronatum]
MWAGVNSYFMANLPEKEQRYLLSSLQAAGVTKVRIFVTQFGAGGKGTNASATPDLEMTTLGKYDDTALLAIDKLMSLVPEYGIKLIIALHDRWNLDSTWGTCDAYCQAFCKYDKDKKACTSAGGAGTFYTDPTAKKFFDKRLDHIVNHSNKYMRWRPWAQISESIYAFEIQNEGQSTLKMPNPNWWCERATKLKYQLSQNGILISTGGAQYPTDAMIDQNFQCKAIDVVAIHAFSDVAPLIPAVLGKAQNYSKTVIFEEFGAQGQGQAPTIEHTAELSNFYRIPWMPWQVSTVTIPDDFEFSPSDTVTWEVLSRFAKAAQ